MLWVFFARNKCAGSVSWDWEGWNPLGSENMWLQMLFLFHIIAVSSMGVWTRIWFHLCSCGAQKSRFNRFTYTLGNYFFPVKDGIWSKKNGKILISLSPEISGNLICFSAKFKKFKNSETSEIYFNLILLFLI